VIVPTILTNDPNEAKEKISFLKGRASRVQIDIIKQWFASPQTISPEDLMGAVSPEDNFFLDWHLMTADPVVYLDKDLPEPTGLVIGQIEMMTSQLEFVRRAKEEGYQAGLAIDLETPLKKLKLQALDFCDQVLVLAVRAGRGGQKFSPSCLLKIRELSSWRQKEGWDFQIAVDGGLNAKTIPLCFEAGAEVFCVGNSIWKADNPGEKIKRLEELLENTN